MNSIQHIRNQHQTHLHFVGIGGIGMSGIAEVFLNQGYPVSGSDQNETETTSRLAELGATIYRGHEAKNIGSARVVVVSSAIKDGNEEVEAARRLRIPVIPRAEMLGELMRGKTGIAIAGTHGKTTTTSMVAEILVACGEDPTVVIGGKVNAFGSNSKLGKGSLVVAEADESDGSFLHLPATFAAITNIDNDHLDHFGSMTEVENAFVRFIGKLPFFGAAVVNADNPGVKRCLARFTKPVVTFSFEKGSDFYAQVETQDRRSCFTLFRREDDTYVELGPIELTLPGRHNIQNAIAATVLALQLNLPFSGIQNGLKEYKGVKRRFEICWKDDDGKRIIVDDYGHHPTEIRATIETARKYWDGRLIVVFQPHRFSRTRDCYDGFLGAFHQADYVVVTEIYAAGEEPIDGVSSENFVRDLRRTLGGKVVEFAKDLTAARDRVVNQFSKGDLVLCLGAGSVTRLPGMISEKLR